MTEIRSKNTNDSILYIAAHNIMAHTNIRRPIMNTLKRMIFLSLLFFVLHVTSCGVFREFGQAVTDLSRCSFKLAGISDFQLAGIPLSGKTALGLGEAAQALASFGRGELPASFTLNVAVQNPNTGSGGTTKSAATLTNFSWTLHIDGTPTVAGDIAEPITIPGTGQQATIPLRMNIDLLKFFRDTGFDKIVNLALALGGAQGSASRVTLRARPTMRTDFGPITYPGEIDIIDTEFRGQ
jgi:hypothetical protein